VNRKLSHYCAVCGNPVENDALAYLLTTNSTTNRLTIFRWHKNLSRIERARAACEPEHALELVAHWMASGTLELDFAQATSCRAPRNADDALAIEPAHFRAQPKPISELTVNRDSLQRVLEENPQALASILDSLLEALQRDKNAKAGVIHTSNEAEARINVP
jgi:hypothetical protein